MPHSYGCRVKKVEQGIQKFLCDLYRLCDTFPRKISWIILVIFSKIELKTYDLHKDIGTREGHIEFYGHQSNGGFIKTRKRYFEQTEG